MKSEDDIKLQIRINLPEDAYSEVITKFKDYSNMSLKKVKKEMKHLQLNKHENKNKSSKWNKQFKGKCYNCGEPGHRASECPKPKKKNNFRKLRRNIKCFICGENHYANNYPQKKSKPEQAYMFVGITDNISENKMKGKIEVMTEIDKLKLVIIILKNISVNQIFEPEGDKAINSQVSMIAHKLQKDYLYQDNDIIEIEYENHIKKKENSNKKSGETLEESDMEVEDNSWTRMKRRG